MEQTTDIQEFSLEKVIDIKLVQNNITEQVIAALKETYGGLKLAALDNKESYLELKFAAKECSKVRNLAVKICKEGREAAVKAQKSWVAREKEVVNAVLAVEDLLDAEIKKYDDEVDRKQKEEKERQEEAYINRQAVLNKMGATYSNGCFLLGEAEFEANLIKGASPDVWDESIVPKFFAEYEKIEAVKVAEQKIKDEELRELKRQQDELKVEQEEMKRQKDEAEREREAKAYADQIEKERIQYQLQTERFNALFPFNPTGADVNMQALWAFSQSDFNAILATKKAVFQKTQEEKAVLTEQKRLADIEAAKQDAIVKEQARVAEEARLAEVKTKEAEEKKQAEFDAMKDKAKWATFIESVGNIETFEMKSSQYRKKMQISKEKLEEILSL